MKTYFKTTSAAVLAMLVAAPAMAGGFAEPMQEPVLAPVAAAAPAAPLLGWGGFYVGGQIGTISAELSFEDENVLDLDGDFYGIHAGYMYDLGNVVLGGEVDYDIIDWTELSIGGDSFNPDVEGTALRLKLRAGYNLGRVLPYATAGIVRLELEGDIEDTENGTFFGAGLAFKATENILVSGEVLRHQFNDVFDEDDLDLEATTVSLRGSYRF